MKVIISILILSVIFESFACGFSLSLPHQKKRTFPSHSSNSTDSCCDCDGTILPQTRLIHQTSQPSSVQTSTVVYECVGGPQCLLKDVILDLEFYIAAPFGSGSCCGSESGCQCACADCPQIINAALIIEQGQDDGVSTGDSLYASDEIQIPFSGLVTLNTIPGDEGMLFGKFGTVTCLQDRLKMHYSSLCDPTFDDRCEKGQIILDVGQSIQFIWTRTLQSPETCAQDVNVNAIGVFSWSDQF